MSIVATPHEGPSAGEPAPQFQQKLGLFDATMLVAGTMIGSGIFIVSADIARDVGSSGWLMLVWVLTGCMTIMGALSYAELAAMMPNAGGQYVYLREAYSPLWGFLYGWTCFLVIQTGSIAAVGVAFSKFLGVLAPELGTDNILWEVKDLNLKLELHVPWMAEKMTFFERTSFTISSGQLVAVVVVIFLTLLNCRGVQEGKVVQNTFTLAKTAGLIVMIVLGLTIAFNWDAVTGNLADPWGEITETERFRDTNKWAPIGLAAVLIFCGAMVGSLFSADAWNNITFTAGEIKNPRRNLPGSLLLGTGLVIFLYLLANMAYLSALPVKGDQAMALLREAQSFEIEAKVAERDVDVLKSKAKRFRRAAEYIQNAQGDGTDERKIRENVRLFLDVDLEPDNVGNSRSARESAHKKSVEATYYRGIDHAKDDRVGTAVLERASPRFGVPFMAIAIMISTFGCVNGMILMGARLYYAMGQDRLFFKSVGQLNQRGVPAVGLILQGIWSILLIFSGSYSELLDYVIWAALFFYVMTVSGLFILRRKRPDLERPYKAWGYPVVPGLYIGLCAMIMLALLFVKPTYSWPSFIIVLSGIPVYFLWKGSRATS